MFTHHSSGIEQPPKLPIVEQPIIVGFEIADLVEMTGSLLNGVYAGLVVRKSQFSDFNNDVLQPITDHNNLYIQEERRFNRVPLSQKGFVQGMRELVHIDTTDHPDKTRKLSFPYTLTVSRTTAGKGLFVAGASSSRVKGWTIGEYNKQQTRLNEHPKIKALYSKRTGSGFNVVYKVPNKGIRGDVGAIHLNEGDVAIFPQGGVGSASPSWHSIITQEVSRDSTSYHLSAKN
jgi:hypothetical protein